MDATSNDGSSHTPVTAVTAGDTKQYQRRWQVYISNLTWVRHEENGSHAFISNIPHSLFVE